MYNENTPILKTERLILRKFTDADIDDLFVLYSDKNVNKFLPWFPFQSVLETSEYLHKNIFADYTKDIAYRYGIIYKPLNKVIGYVSIHNIDISTSSGELGYALCREFWGMGIVSEACGAVLQKLK